MFVGRQVGDELERGERLRFLQTDGIDTERSTAWRIISVCRHDQFRAQSFRIGRHTLRARFVRPSGHQLFGSDLHETIMKGQPFDLVLPEGFDTTLLEGSREGVFQIGLRQCEDMRKVATQQTEIRARDPLGLPVYRQTVDAMGALPNRLQKARFVEQAHAFGMQSTRIAVARALPSRIYHPSLHGALVETQSGEQTYRPTADDQRLGLFHVLTVPVVPTPRCQSHAGRMGAGSAVARRMRTGNSIGSPFAHLGRSRLPKCEHPRRGDTAKLHVHDALGDPVFRIRILKHAGRRVRGTLHLYGRIMSRTVHRLPLDFCSKP